MRPAREDGFSIVEVAVVLVILFILIGIALPTFIGVRSRAQDTAAKETAVLTLKTAQALATDGSDSFAGVTTAGLGGAEPSRTFVDGDEASTGPAVASQLVPDLATGAQIYVVAVHSESGSCFYARTLIQGGTDYADVDGVECRAEDYGSAVFRSSW